MRIFIQAGSNVDKLLLNVTSMKGIQPAKHDSINLDPIASVLLQQGEYATFNNNVQFTSPIQYVGSKNTWTCIFIYLYNAENHFCIHVDPDRIDLNFAEAISHFKNKTDLKVILCGGMINPAQTTPAEMQNEIALRNIKTVLQQLIGIATTYQTEIEVTQQALGMANLADMSQNTVDRDYTALNLVLDKADILYRYLFGEALDIQSLNISQEMLKSKKGQKDATENYIRVLFNCNVYMKIPDHLQSAYQILASKNKQEFKEILLTNINEHMRNYFNKYLPPTATPLCRDFVIDINSKNVISILRLTPTPNEWLRSYENLDNRFHHVFNNGVYQFPTISENFSKNCKLITKNKAHGLRRLTNDEISLFNQSKKVAGRQLGQPEDIGNIVLKYINAHYEVILAEKTPVSSEFKVDDASTSSKNPQSVSGIANTEAPTLIFNLQRSQNELKNTSSAKFNKFVLFPDETTELFFMDKELGMNRSALLTSTKLKDIAADEITKQNFFI